MYDPKLRVCLHVKMFCLISSKKNIYNFASYDMVFCGDLVILVEHWKNLL